jgi:hypothetical protein
MDLTVEVSKFQDQTVTKDVSNAVQQPVKTADPKPQPAKRPLPPPKKVEKEIKEVFSIVEEMPRFVDCGSGTYEDKKAYADKKC